MRSGLILAVDQGTTNSKALVFGGDGRVVASAAMPMAVSYPRPGWAEQSPLDIWASVRRVIGDVVTKVGSDIDALAISNQRETIVVWDGETGQPVGPAILWQCRRTADRCAALLEAGHAATIEGKTGLALDPLFPAAKIAWILDNVVGAREAATQGRLRAGTIDCWLLWKLTGHKAHATDHSNASRTQLFDTRALVWDEQLADIFGVPLSLLAAVRPSDSVFGETSPNATALPAGVPIHAMIGDSHAALYGHGVRQPGTVKATYGTGTSLMTLTSRRVASTHGLSSTIAWSTTAGGPVHALEGNISVSGQSAAFMAEMLGLADANALADLAGTVTTSNGAHFVPALVGLGAPYWTPEARGVIAGLALGTQRAHLARAAIEAIAFQVADVFVAMEADLGHPLARLSADGGATRNDFLMQFQADVIGRPVLRSDLAEVSAAGAAMLARSALGTTIQTSETATQFDPAIDAAARASLLGGWHDAVARTLLRPASNRNMDGKGETLMSSLKFGAGIWHFATYVDRYATDGYGEPRSVIEAIDLAGKVSDLSVVDINWPFFGGEFSNQQIKAALDRNKLGVIGITPEIYTREFSKGAFTNPDPGIRRAAHELITKAADVVRDFKADYVKLWPGQDGWDYPFQVDHGVLWKNSIDGVGQLASENPDLKFVIEYKPREPRVHMSFDSLARTLLGIEKIGLPNVGILLDFGHALFGGESPADSAQMAIDYGRLFGMDVNDNYRSWDDDLVAGSLHPIELFEFFHVLRKNKWDGVWQLDQFPFRDDSVATATLAIDFLKAVDRGLDALDLKALKAAQDRHDAITAMRLAQKALFSQF